MKISVSLPAEDVAFLDSYVLRHRVPSRSAVFHEALALLRSSTLEESYAEAFGEWAGSDDEAAWDVVRGDGVTDASARAPGAVADPLTADPRPPSVGET